MKEKELVNEDLVNKLLKDWGWLPAKKLWNSSNDTFFLYEMTDKERHNGNLGLLNIDYGVHQGMVISWYELDDLVDMIETVFPSRCNK